MAWGWGGYAPYVSVAEKKIKAEKLVEKLRKKGQNISPVVITGKNIASSFWGKSWCENLAKYSDYESRLPRGRSYAKNGAVIDLKIDSGAVNAQVNGSSLYNVKIKITPVENKKWKDLCAQSANSIGSVIELLQGKFSKAVMELFCDKNQGLFPAPSEIKMSCSCLDWAGMCKHVAATMYGIGARLDDKPELLFKLRGVDASELIGAASINLAETKTTSKSKRIIEADDLGDVFGIDLEGGAPTKPTEKKPKPKPTKDAKPKKRSTKEVEAKAIAKKKLAKKTTTKKATKNAK